MVSVATTPAEFFSALPPGGRDEVTAALARHLRDLFAADGVAVLLATPDRWAVESATRSGRVARSDRPGSSWRACHGGAAAIAPVGGDSVGSDCHQITTWTAGMIRSVALVVTAVDTPDRLRALAGF